MKTKFLTIIACLVFGNAITAQVLVQPVTGVHTIKVEDNVTLKIYSGDKTQLEVDNNLAIAQISNGVMFMEGNTSAVLRLNPADGIVNFSVEDGASILFNGPFDFGDQKITISAEDNARVEMDVTANGLYAGHAFFKAQDNSLIISKVAPIHVYGYNFIANDNAYIEVPSVDLRLFDGDSAIDRNTYLTVTDYGKIVIKDKGPDGIIVCDHEFSIGGRKSKKPRREYELNWTWGFNNWLDDHPFSGRIGEPDGAAEVSYYFMNVGLSFDCPIINTPHFGLYAGLGIEGNRYHFREHRVVATPTGFQAPSGNYPALADITSGNPDPNNWDSYFNTYTLTVPITFSFEPWNYNDLCIRLTALPGINVYGALLQDYQSNTAEVEVRNREVGNQVNDFSFDARLAVYYGSLGLYAQMSFSKLFDFGLYPVKFGLVWSIAGR